MVEWKHFHSACAISFHLDLGTFTGFSPKASLSLTIIRVAGSCLCLTPFQFSKSTKNLVHTWVPNNRSPKACSAIARACTLRPPREARGPCLWLLSDSLTGLNILRFMENNDYSGPKRFIQLLEVTKKLVFATHRVISMPVRHSDTVTLSTPCPTKRTLKETKTA